jgi:hypothetical protein
MTATEIAAALGGAPANDSEEGLIDRTRQVRQPRLGRDLSREEARQIAENMTGSFALLAEWSRPEVSSPANDTGKPVAPNEEARRS